MVSIDENAAMELIMRHLTERGAHAVAYMASKEISFESAELFTMFHTQVRSYRLTTHTDWNQFGERTVQRGYDCSMRLFGQLPSSRVRSSSGSGRSKGASCGQSAPMLISPLPCGLFLSRITFCKARGWVGKQPKP